MQKLSPKPFMDSIGIRLLIAIKDYPWNHRLGDGWQHDKDAGGGCNACGVLTKKTKAWIDAPL